jgi:hypothetical protein
MLLAERAPESLTGGIGYSTNASSSECKDADSGVTVGIAYD